jgi:hypothetical protein
MPAFSRHAANDAHLAQTIPTFAHYAEQVYANEQARVARGELARDSLLVMRNRLDLHVLPRFGSQPVSRIDYLALLEFVQELSIDRSTITVSQYLVILRKVFRHAWRCKAIAAMPELPAVKIRNTPRGAFTPGEYWRILRCARQLRGQPHPLDVTALRIQYKLRHADRFMPPDLAWAIGFMVNSFIRPSDLKTLRHRHVEEARQKTGEGRAHVYLRLTLPETKRHAQPIVTLTPAVRIYRALAGHAERSGFNAPDDYLFLPHLRDRHYALGVLGLMFNWVLDELDLKLGPHGQGRTLYSLRHSAITFRLLYGHGIDLLTLARNARTSVEVISQHYASTLAAEQNIALLQSRRR